ncbi:MAG: 1-(5-phosphoribosyl)-5-[(5-phosphoribosylamino)methylideneamino]imidazole-4-carboxamide isomerase [Deltaproteobacteria bacterium]|nr:1-(5-phosphoribosyl)-5-[(5-phosphoribosylamino)methylideneamino]imidazole-4-carboxamide isomerase [Deltaproteobacteria bacterium]MBF0525841.1 1-(5-phosphoribosyl)-5-[(5-phosphoribosylamino)methylideneamino]imidazole-4-carboxamide isomerase [Deltaproteobacteria bacterium]
MLVIPAVDLKGGRCVRLRQGRMDEETVFSDNPVDMALKWQAYGAGLIHVVDLDGAVNSRPQNLEVIKKMVTELDVPIELGGGIRDLDTVSMYLDLGVGRVILGTAAIKSPDLVEKSSALYPGQVIVGIDAKSNKVSVGGWIEETHLDPVKIALDFDGLPLAAFIYTDIGRDGMETGPNITGIKAMVDAVTRPVIAAGGVSNIDDIRALLPLAAQGLDGVITGRAIYTGSLDLREALNLVNSAAK